ncbi:MAG: tryptophan-rich sensory protein [Chlorobiaceae bacterium]|nr:tryptophan-rich sensory protein [Chlorobiaceae bacterium]NTW74418.1 tryptophan-rich sensory protein [Chlorobiaceae bacterium]
MNSKFLTVAVCVSICILFAFAGSLFTPEPGSWYYTTLQKPSWNPPDWIFPPVWTLLFILMGVALSMVLEVGMEKKEVRQSAALFGLQLFLNLGWSASFFGMRSPLAGFVEILILWLAIVATIVSFSRVSRPAALLLVPYICWVSFASFLNFTILRLNP